MIGYESPSWWRPEAVTLRFLAQRWALLRNEQRWRQLRWEIQQMRGSWAAGKAMGKPIGKWWFNGIWWDMVIANYNSYNLVGWYNGTWIFYFLIWIGNVIIPVDLNIFRMGSNHQPEIWDEGFEMVELDLPDQTANSRLCDPDWCLRASNLRWLYCWLV